MGPWQWPTPGRARLLLIDLRRSQAILFSAAAAAAAVRGELGWCAIGMLGAPNAQSLASDARGATEYTATEQGDRAPAPRPSDGHLTGRLVAPN